jgi:hypothetical protein
LIYNDDVISLLKQCSHDFEAFYTSDNCLRAYLSELLNPDAKRPSISVNMRFNFASTAAIIAQRETSPSLPNVLTQPHHSSTINERTFPGNERHQGISSSSSSGTFGVNTRWMGGTGSIHTPPVASPVLAKPNSAIANAKTSSSDNVGAINNAFPKQLFGLVLLFSTSPHYKPLDAVRIPYLCSHGVTDENSAAFSAFPYTSSIVISLYPIVPVPVTFQTTLVSLLFH